MAKWAAFWLVGLIWGSSFLLIRIGVSELTPFQVVFIRTGIAAIGMNLVLLLRGKHLPFNFKELFPLIVIGIGNTTLPFALISWGETRIPSSLAGVLQSAAVFFSMIIAHYSFSDEKLSLQKIAGMIVGFIGVVVLVTRGAGGESGEIAPEFWGAMAVVVASLCYAIFTVYSRKNLSNSRYEPVMVSAGAMTFGAISSGLALLVAPLLGGETGPLLSTVAADTLNAVILLGFLNTFVAYLIYYWIVRELGVGRTSMVTYITPVVSVFLGALILHETIDTQLLFGAALIFLGIGVVNLKAFRWINGLRKVPSA